MGAALKFRTAGVPRQAQEKARLKVLHGPDTGAVFVISGLSASIGRGEENDIVLTDLKASRRHAEFSFLNNQWAVRDLGSANGIIYNGKTTRTSVIRSGDTVTLGETTIEFLTPEAGTMVLSALPRTLSEVESEQAQFRAQQDKVRNLARLGGPPGQIGSPAPHILSKEKNPRILLIVAALGIVAFVLFGSEDTPKRIMKRVETVPLASYLPETDQAVNKSAEVFFRSGFREYRQRNYLRARMQFETVLQIEPGHQLATLYLQNCNKAINEEVKFHLQHGKRAYEAGSLKQARLHYEAILRLLYRDQSNPSYIEARDQLATVNKEIAEGT
jgi:hypothetical protein